MGPESLLPKATDNKQLLSPWLVVGGIFLTGLCMGTFVPLGMKFFGFWDEGRLKLVSSHGLAGENSGTPAPAPKARKIEHRLPRVADLAKSKESPPLPSRDNMPAVDSSKLASVHADRKDKKLDKKKKDTSNNAEKALVRDNVKTEKSLGRDRKSEKTIAKNSKVPASEARSVESSAKVESSSVGTPLALIPRPLPAGKPAAAPAAVPTGDLIEEVPTAVSAQQVQKLMQANTSSGQIANPQMANARPNAAAALVRPVSLPPGQALNVPVSPVRTSIQPPILKSDPKSDGKTYPVTINNASFSKVTLSSCAKRCILLGLDAFGNPIRAVIDGPTFASALLQHNGSINISGQPRLMKNQQVLVVENITFNLSPANPKVAAKSAKARQTAAVTGPIAGDNKGYTDIPSDPDDLKPGTVIKSRKQIPADTTEELPVPAAP